MGGGSPPIGIAPGVGLSGIAPGLSGRPGGAWSGALLIGGFGIGGGGSSAHGGALSGGCCGRPGGGRLGDMPGGSAATGTGGGGAASRLGRAERFERAPAPAPPVVVPPALAWLPGLAATLRCGGGCGGCNGAIC